MPNVAQLMQALPDDLAAERPEGSTVLAHYAMRPVPVGRLRRAGLLATLQAKVAAAYLFYWVRGWFASAEQRERLLAETHWRTAALLATIAFSGGSM